MSKPPADVPHQRVLNASLSGDVNMIVSMFADDAIFMPPNDTTVFGKEEIKAWWEEYFSFFRLTSSVDSSWALRYNSLHFDSGDAHGCCALA